MTRCPKCKSEDYEVYFIADDEYHGNEVVVLLKANCCDCNTKFWVKETFTFTETENVLQKTNHFRFVFYCIELDVVRLISTEVKFSIYVYKILYTKYCIQFLGCKLCQIFKKCTLKLCQLINKRSRMCLRRRVHLSNFQELRRELGAASAAELHLLYVWEL